MRRIYSTDNITTEERFSYWNDVVCQHFIPASCRSSHYTNFSACLSVNTLGNLSLANMSAPHHSWTRKAQHLRNGPNEDFMLSLMVSGVGHLSQANREVQQQAGDFVLYDAARSFTFDLAPKSTLLLRIPRKQILYRIPGAENLVGIRFNSNAHPIGTLLRDMLVQASSIELHGLHGAETSMANSLLDLLAVFLRVCTEGFGNSGNRHGTLFQHAKEYITAHLDDESIHVDQIAAALNVSPRTLLRIFAENGVTPMKWLWKQRLEASYCALREGRVHQVTQVAFQFGFSNLSHFSRVFKKTYGVSPQELLLQSK